MWGNRKPCKTNSFRKYNTLAVHINTKAHDCITKDANDVNLSKIKKDCTVLDSKYSQMYYLISILKHIFDLILDKKRILDRNKDHFINM